MNLKKLAASITALSCFSGVLAYMPDMTWDSYAAEVVSNDFEVNYEGWHPNADNVTLTAIDSIGNSASRGMKVSGRSTAKDGASSSKGLYLVGGTYYEYSLYVYSEKDETFNLSLLTKDEKTDEETVKKLVSKKVKGGEWTKLTAGYKAPADSYEFELTLNTDSTDDFTFDDVKITTKNYKNSASAATAQKGLKDEFANYFRVGNILNGGTVKNSGITANIIKDCNSVECENETKPDATLNQSQSSGNNIGVKLDSAAAIFDFCVNNNIAVRGHTFVWHSQTPSWFFKDNLQNGGNWVDKNTMNARMESYIKNLFAAIKTQYPDLYVYAYDVCNECVSDDSNRTANYGGAREPGDSKVNGQGGKSAWVQVYGDNSFVEQAFTYARKYAPEGCDLYYNDYNEYWDHKRDCIYNMCKNLYNKGLLDGVGMQSHVPANSTGFAGTDSYLQAMDKYLSIGCDVQVTELDISLENGKYSLQDQANKYKAIFQHAMDVNTSGKYNGKVTAVCIWGPNDANSWLSSGSNALLYDSNNQPKLAYTTLTSMIPQSEWGDGTAYNGEIKTPEPNEYGWYFQHGFEGTTEGWEGRGAASIMTSGRTAYVGSEALLVQDRTASWNGASFNLNSRAFKAGEEYSFSANVNYFDGADTTDFKFTLQFTNSEGKTDYDEIAHATGVRGQWVQLANTNYKIPEGATDLMIYVETSDETTENFYIDEVIGAVAGTGIKGAGQPVIKKVILGDTNFDGKISALDLAIARKGLTGGFADSSTEKAADVDQSGVYEVNDLVLINEFILGAITEFPVAKKVIDTSAMENIFKNVTVNGSWKADGENNVLWTQRFGADPGFMVYKDRLYVFTTNDAFEYNNDGQIHTNTYNSQTINCFSSSDLVNWTDHGAIPAAGSNGAAKWAHFAWAPDACWKTINGKDKFFLYFADSAGGIGVLTADSPEGPYTDPIGKALINKSTPGFSDVTWLFDPAVLVDDDGTGYLYVGGGVPEGKNADPGTARAVKLGDDMTSLSGQYAKMNPPYLFEDSSILKVGNTYYYSYCTNWNTGGNPYGFNNAEIAVMTSTNPLGPFTYKGIALKNPASYQLDGGGNNHHSIVEFKGKYYVLYHSRHQSRAMNIQAIDNNTGKIDLGGNYRSCHIDNCTFENGMFKASGTMKGVSQIEAVDPYTKVQAENMSNQSKNIKVNGLCDTTVAGDKGEWIKTSGVNFSKGEKSITIKASSKSGSVIKVCTGSPSGTAMTYVEIPAGSSQEITVPIVSEVSGQKDVYFVFSGQTEMDYWFFS